MKRRKLCEDCFFYDLTSKDCATAHKMPLKGDQCHFFEQRVMITIYDEDKLDIRDNEVVPDYLKMA